MSTASSLLYPVKLIFDYLISPFKSMREDPNCEKDPEALEKVDGHDIFPQNSAVIMDQNLPHVSSPDMEDAYGVANEMLTSELSFNEITAGEVVYDSQDNGSDFRLCTKRKLNFTKKEPKLLAQHDPLWHSNKPRISVKYNPEEQSNLKKYIDQIERQKRSRLK